MFDHSISAVVQQFQRELILGSDLHEIRWHVDIIKTTFTQDLPTILPELLDELPSAVQGNIPCADGKDVSPPQGDVTEMLPSCRMDNFERSVRSNQHGRTSEQSRFWRVASE